MYCVHGVWFHYALLGPKICLYFLHNIDRVSGLVTCRSSKIQSDISYVGDFQTGLPWIGWFQLKLFKFIADESQLSPRLIAFDLRPAVVRSCAPVKILWRDIQVETDCGWRLMMFGGFPKDNGWVKVDWFYEVGSQHPLWSSFDANRRRADEGVLIHRFWSCEAGKIMNEIWGCTEVH